MPLISVIIPTFNRRDSISKAIDSVLNQTISDWELIIIDDGSQDDTCEIVKPFLQDPRIRYNFQENRGVSSARNTGAKLAKGNWLVFLDSDDLFTQSAFENFFETIQSDLSVGIWKSGCLLRIGTKEEIELPKEGELIPFLVGCFILKRSIFNSIKGFDEKLRFSENTELLHRIKLSEYKIKTIQKPTLIYNSHPHGGSKNLKNMNDSLSHILKIHKKTLTSDEKRLYYQIMGVNSLRFQEFPSARKNLLTAYSLKLWRIDTLARLIISYLPIISRKIYKLL